MLNRIFMACGDSLDVVGVGFFGGGWRCLEGSCGWGGGEGGSWWFWFGLGCLFGLLLTICSFPFRDLNFPCFSFPFRNLGFSCFCLPLCYLHFPLFSFLSLNLNFSFISCFLFLNLNFPLLILPLPPIINKLTARLLLIQRLLHIYTLTISPVILFNAFACIACGLYRYAEE